MEEAEEREINGNTEKPKRLGNPIIPTLGKGLLPKLETA
jgi:hypothetical protein